MNLIKVQHVVFVVSLFVFLGFGTGCKSGAQLEGINSSLNEINRAAIAVIGKPRHVSKDYKEIQSVYRDRKGNEIENPTKVRERQYTSVYILGDRRPFSIQVEVVEEIKNELGQFDFKRKNEKEGMKISAKIKSELAKGKDGKNVIDDFRPF